MREELPHPQVYPGYPAYNNLIQLFLWFLKGAVKGFMQAEQKGKVVYQTMKGKLIK